MRCDIITPERPVFSGECQAVIVPARDGLIGILPGHAPMVAELGAGVVEIDSPKNQFGEFKALKFAVNEGFLQVVDDKVTLLAVRAALPDDSDENTLSREAETVLEKLRAPESDEQFQELLSRREWVEARQAIHGTETARPRD